MQVFFNVLNKRNVYIFDSSDYDMEIKVIFLEIIFLNYYIVFLKKIFIDYFYEEV